jgi:hypothetical protein
MLLALQAPAGWRPILTVDQFAVTSPSNTTYLYGFSSIGTGWDNAPEASFMDLVKPLMGQTLTWAQMQAFYINPQQAYDILQAGQIPFPFIPYLTAAVTLIGVEVQDGQTLYYRLEFQESPFTMFLTNPCPDNNGNDPSQTEM